MESAPSRPKELLENQVQERPACQHHWVIEKPSGPLSKGACRLCGEEKEFQNYVDGSAWGHGVSRERLSGRSRISAGIDVRSDRERAGFDKDE